MNEWKVIVDTSIFFSFLLHRTSDHRRLFQTDLLYSFYCPRFFLVELFKHKERIALISELAPDELLETLHELLARVQFVEEGGVPVGTWMEARRLCQGVDLKDAPFVALTLHLGGRLWTSDAELKTGLRNRGFDQFFEP